MTTNKVEQLQRLRAELAELEQQFSVIRQREFASLPERYGFKSTADFVAAVQKAGGARRGRPPAKSKETTQPKRRGRRRAKISDAIRARVKKMVEAGKTGAAIAAKLGISLPSVQIIKKAFGLVRSRAK